MMSEATLLESRVSKIEQDNRRLKLTVGALLLVLTGAACAGAMMPEQIPELIQAREFRAIDENGNARAVMNDFSIDYFDENGTLRAGMTLGGITLRDVTGNLRGTMNELSIGFENERGSTMMTSTGFFHFDGSGLNEIWSSPGR